MCARAGWQQTVRASWRRGDEQAPGHISHEDALDLAALYVLGALDDGQDQAVRRHLDGCGLPHDELAALRGASQALALAVEPVDAPVHARERVLAAVASLPQSRVTLPAMPKLRLAAAHHWLPAWPGCSAWAPGIGRGTRGSGS
jgi:hypothetical protein